MPFGYGCSGGHKGFLLPSAETHYAPDLKICPMHMDVWLDVDIRNRVVIGKTVISAKATNKCSTLQLNAVDFVNVAVSDLDGRDLQWRYDGELIHIYWPNGVTTNDELRVQVTYKVEKPVSGLLFNVPDKHYPDMCLTVASDNETERARYWMPCVDFPTVRTAFDFHITADAAFSSVAGGSLVKITEVDGQKKCSHWQLKFPTPSYLACFAVGDIQTVEDGVHSGMPVAYLGPNNVPADHLRRAFGKTPSMIAWLQEKLGSPFPAMPKYYTIAVPGILGAMENVSLVTFDGVFMLDETWSREFQLLTDAVTIHEMTHSYFGDSLVIRHFEHAWLKESWATYMEAVWIQDHHSRDWFDYDMFVNATRYFSECDSYVRPIVTRTYDHSWSMFDAHTYPGGAWRIHMLRRRMGDDLFWKGVADYVKHHTHDVVETDDFRRALEKASGENFTKFFDQWVYGKGYPKLKASFSHNAEQKEATITIEQTQEDKEQGVGVFDFDLDIFFEEENGAVHTTKVIFNGNKRASAVVRGLTGKVTMVRLDPDLSVLFKLDFSPGLDLLTAAAHRAPTVVERVRAYQELAKLGSCPALNAIKEGIAKERVPWVRAEISTALASCHNAAAAEMLGDLLVTESDPLAMHTIASACSLRHPSTRHALLTYLGRPDTLYRARARALESLGSQRHSEDFALLAEAADDTSLHGLVRMGAITGLGRLGSAEAFAFIRSRCAYGADSVWRSRPAAVSALANCSLWLDNTARKEAGQVASDLLLDPSEPVRKAAASALATLGNTEYLGVIESMKSTLAKQFHPWVDVTKNKLKNADDDCKKKLEKEAAEMEKRVLALEKEVSVLKAAANTK